MSVVLQRSKRAVAGDLHRAEVRHVEHDGVAAAGQVLGDRAGRVLERHVPAAERHHPGAERAVDGVERRALAAPTSSRDGSARRRRRRRRRAARSWASMSSLTPASGSTLSTPWPLAQHVDQLVAVAEHHLVAADDDVRRRRCRS